MLVDGRAGQRQGFLLGTFLRVRQFSIPGVILDGGVIGPVVALDRGWSLVDPALGYQAGVLFLDDLLHHLYPVDLIVDLFQLPVHLLLVIVEDVVGKQNEPSLLIRGPSFLSLAVLHTQQLQPQPLNILIRLLALLPLILQLPLYSLLVLVEHDNLIPEQLVLILRQQQVIELVEVLVPLLLQVQPLILLVQKPILIRQQFVLVLELVELLEHLAVAHVD